MCFYISKSHTSVYTITIVYNEKKGSNGNHKKKYTPKQAKYEARSGSKKKYTDIKCEKYVATTLTSETIGKPSDLSESSCILKKFL